MKHLRLFLTQKITRLFAIVSLLMVSATLSPASAQASVGSTLSAETTLCNPVVEGNHSGLNGTTHAMAFDGEISTYFESSHDNWQYMQIDFYCVQSFNAIRRYMTPDGDPVTIDSFAIGGQELMIDNVCPGEHE